MWEQSLIKLQSDHSSKLQCITEMTCRIYVDLKDWFIKIGIMKKILPKVITIISDLLEFRKIKIKAKIA